MADKKIILIAQCIINPYCRVHILGYNFPLSGQLMDYLMHKKVGVIQYLCPEITAVGLLRNPQGRQQYDSAFFREHCRELLRIPMLMINEFIENHYRLVASVGVEGSPTCSIHWGRHKVNKYQTESAVALEDHGLEESVLMGIMTEILATELMTQGIEVPLLEFPLKTDPNSEITQKFWKELKRTVEPEIA